MEWADGILRVSRQELTENLEKGLEMQRGQADANGFLHGVIVQPCTRGKTKEQTGEKNKRAGVAYRGRADVVRRAIRACLTPSGPRALQHRDDSLERIRRSLELRPCQVPARHRDVVNRKDTVGTRQGPGHGQIARAGRTEV